MANRLIIGLMSGTSVDAIDAALVRVDSRGARGELRSRYRAEVVKHVEHRWPASLRARLLGAMAPAATTTQEICELNFLVAQEFAAAVEELLAAAKISRNKIAALASHGQTICHLPPAQSKIKNRKSKMGSTLQLGDPSVLATLTGITTVGNFRPADMAAGGQGAPLVPWADAMLLSHETRVRCVQNIGGIANVTYLPPASGRWSVTGGQLVIAFDTGPGNMLIDAVVSHATKGRMRFDRDGNLARRGTLDEKLFRRLQRHDYFRIKPPKSTGREVFGVAMAEQVMKSQIRNLKLENLIHTLTLLTAWSIADAYRRFLPRVPDEIILCGGGADNPVLTDMLASELSAHFPARPPVFRRIDDFGIPNKSKEAASFALLAAATLEGVPSNMPSVTGAKRGAVLGVIAIP